MKHENFDHGFFGRVRRAAKEEARQAIIYVVRRRRVINDVRN